ncbi:MAG: UDP-N-acetylglucosamine 2-epimerase (non-hydrolyzing) [Verrucomicrobiota bacterium]|nr:UDP-N-acetylglucosamine 2-epimerase (non-hydrolyzing) [Verrucomicrobiota bacterium]
MKVLTVVGARPQFVKVAMVSRALAVAGIEEALVHTGQHYDETLSRVFFEELGIPAPRVNLGVGSGTHAFQTGEAMRRLEPLCVEQRPDRVLVYGDTNTTLAGALTAAKLHIPVAHVEAGLRSFDRGMSEEINRIVADSLSAFLFCPTETAARNLAAEGIVRGVHNVGDVMIDAALRFGVAARAKSRILDRLGLAEKGFVLATIHRDFNTDERVRLAGIVAGLVACGEQVVFPAHPRVRKQLAAFGLDVEIRESSKVRLIDPVGYLDMIRLEMAARVIVTDSGGVQKEALFHGVPCVTARPSTEWVETVELGWNRLVEPDAETIRTAVAGAKPPARAPPVLYGDGHSAERIAEILA